MRRRSFVVATLLAAATGFLNAAGAESFDIRPITIETRDGLGLIIVTNPGDQRIYLQSQVFDWSQDVTGGERTVESEVAIASPPAMWVPPRSSYTMRIRLPGGAPDAERAFRVVIRQLPEQSDITGGRVVFALTQNLPAFVVPVNPSPPALSIRSIGLRRIAIQNGGGRRVQVTGVKQNGRLIASGLVGYALAHGALAVSLARPVHPGWIELNTDLGRRSLLLR